MKVNELLPDRTAYTLAADADCAGPDTEESAGALFLVSVFDDVRERIDYFLKNEQDDSPSIPAMVRDWENEGTIHKIADDAPDVYTHTRWQEFVDLAAYNEDISEYGDYGDDLTKAAGVALYMIAERLILALLEEAEKAADEIAND